MVRPADAAAALGSLVVEVLRIHHNRDGNRDRMLHPYTLQRLLVSMATTSTTVADHLLNATQLARYLRFPVATTVRRLKELQASGEISEVGGVYITDLDRLDSIITREDVYRAIDVTERTLQRLYKVRDALAEVGDIDRPSAHAAL